MVATNERIRILCPRCTSNRIRRSTRRGPVEWILKQLRVLPYRCIHCDLRFRHGPLSPVGSV